MTENKIDSFAKRLESHENFIKHHYVLQKLGIQCSVQELYDDYVEFCKKEQRTAFKKIEFGAKLKELGIEYYKTNGHNKYKISTEFLHELATTRHWIHEIDDYCEEQPTKEEQGTKENDELIQRCIQSEKELKALKNENEQLRLELEALKEAKKEAVVVRVIEDSDEEESEAPQQQIENNKLKKEIKELRVKLDKLRNVRAERNKYHELWFDNLSEKEQKQEEERWLKEQEKEKKEKGRKEHAKVNEDKPPTPPPAPTPVKSILSIIDDSDEEGEEEVETVKIKDNKIMSALECVCDFVD